MANIVAAAALDAHAGLAKDHQNYVFFLEHDISVTFKRQNMCQNLLLRKI